MAEPASGWRSQIEAAAAAGRLRVEDARLVLALKDRDGTLVAPNARYRDAVREILAAVDEIEDGIEIEVEKPAPKTATRASERPRKRRKRRKRTQAPSKPEPAPERAKAAQAPPSRPSKTPEERRIAWAWANQDEAAALLRANAHALAAAAAPELYGPDSDPQLVACIVNPNAEKLFYSPHFNYISSIELLRVAENLGLLAHAVEHYRPNDRENPILPAPASGAPAVHVRRDRLPALPAKPGAVQSALPFVPETPQHVLPVLIRGGEAMGNNMVPLRWRFWYEALLSAPLAAYGGEASFPVTLAEIVQFAGWKQWREREHLEPLHDALVGLYDMAINWRNTEWRMVSVTNPPGRGVTLDTPIVFHVHVPPGSRHGPQIHRPTLRQLYRHAPKARALLALSAYWDRYGRGQGGADALATSPRANAWPVLTPEALRLMMFPDKEQRVYRTRAVNHAKAMHKAGIIDMVAHGSGWRIYRPLN